MATHAEKQQSEKLQRNLVERALKGLTATIEEDIFFSVGDIHNYLENHKAELSDAERWERCSLFDGNTRKYLEYLVQEGRATRVERPHGRGKRYGYRSIQQPNL